MNKLSTSIILSVMLITLYGCTSVPKQPPMITRQPTGWLSGSVNTSNNEIAPWIDESDHLHFTRDSIRVQRQRTEKDAPSKFQMMHIAIQDGEVYRHIGSDTSVRISQDINSGVKNMTVGGVHFFSSTAIDSLLLQHTSVPSTLVAGSDIFELKESKRIQNIGVEINSPYWDAHPAFAGTKDSLVLIFASDRPTLEQGKRLYPKGYGMPHENQKSIIDSMSADTINGNSDLYYVFRIGGVWDTVRNFNSVYGIDTINSRYNEYSPFVYCPDVQPVLYFSTQRNTDTSDGKRNGNISSVCLSINYSRRTITTSNWQTLSIGEDSINTQNADERFPFVTTEESRKVVYVSSNRDSDGSRIDSSGVPKVRVVAKGGYDIYKFPLENDNTCPCILPEYNVVIINSLNPKEKILNSKILAINSYGDTIQTSNKSVLKFTLKKWERFKVYGSSTFNKDCKDIPANGKELLYYRWRSVANVGVKSFDTISLTRTIKKNGTIIKHDTTIYRDSVIYRKQFSLVSMKHPHSQSIQPVKYGKTIVQCYPAVKNAKIISSSDSEIVFVVKEQKTLYDTTNCTTEEQRMRRVDTIESSQVVSRIDTSSTNTASMAVSVLSMNSDISLTTKSILHNGIPTIYDTIWVEPVYYVDKCLSSIKELSLKGVPFFQTCYWKVNDPLELDSTLPILEQSYKPGKDSTTFRYIELHPRYHRWFEKNNPKGELRRLRVEQFKKYALLVQTSFNQLADSVLFRLEHFLSTYNSETLPSIRPKFVIDMTAFSDRRGIDAALYFDEDISYVSHDTSNTIKKSKDKPNNFNLVQHKRNTYLDKANKKLSELRAYYAYKNFMQRLSARDSVLNKGFNNLVHSNQVAFPHLSLSVKDFEGAINTSTIVFLVRGRGVDSTMTDSLQTHKYYETKEITNVRNSITRYRDSITHYADSKQLQFPVRNLRGSGRDTSVDINFVLNQDANRYVEINVQDLDYGNGVFSTPKDCECMEIPTNTLPQVHVTKPLTVRRIIGNEFLPIVISLKSSEKTIIKSKQLNNVPR